jgi:hypothetical protein
MVKDACLVLTVTTLPIPRDIRPPPDGYIPARSSDANSRHDAMDGDDTVAFINSDSNVLRPEDHMQESLGKMVLVFIGSCTCDCIPGSDVSSIYEDLEVRPTVYGNNDRDLLRIDDVPRRYPKTNLMILLVETTRPTFRYLRATGLSIATKTCVEPFERRTVIQAQPMRRAVTMVMRKAVWK